MSNYDVMKKIFLAVMTMMVAVAAYAWTPNTKWPYLFEHFTDGTLHRGQDYSEAKFNIHLQGNILHYINPTDDKIYEAKQNDMDSVVIEGRTYVVSNRQVMEVVGQHGKNLVLKLEYGNFDPLFSSTGAYGASLNSSSSQNWASLDLAGHNNPRHGLMLQEKEDGRSFTTRTKYFLRIGKVDVEAKKSDVEELVPAEKKDAWKQFLKQQKIKWKDAGSLEKVLEFFK